jgi:hypothetical protein
MRDIMLYQIQMPYLMYENDEKQADSFKFGKFIKRHDNTTNEKLLHVKFCIIDDAVHMTTRQPLTYIYAGKTQSMSIDDKVYIPLNHDVVLCSPCGQNPRIKVRVVKLDDPRDPTPPPEDRVRGVTWSYDAVDIAPPPPQAPQAPRTDRLPSTRPTTPEPEAPPQTPPPKPQKPKRQKRQDFYMVA